MQIVVNITEEEYESIKKHPHWHSLGELIANGTPLPKGHGNLVDTNELIENGVATESYLNTFIKTIIKADKEEE